MALLNGETVKSGSDFISTDPTEVDRKIKHLAIIEAMQSLERTVQDFDHLAKRIEGEKESGELKESAEVKRLSPSLKEFLETGAGQLRSLDKFLQAVHERIVGMLF